MSQRLPALNFPDFKLFLFGRFLGNVGASVQFWAVAWHVYDLSGQSSLHVGLIALVRVVPLILFALIGGVVADQMDRRKLTLITRATMIAGFFYLGTVCV